METCISCNCIYCIVMNSHEFIRLPIWFLEKSQGFTWPCFSKGRSYMMSFGFRLSLAQWLISQFYTMNFEMKCIDFGSPHFPSLAARTDSDSNDVVYGCLQGNRVRLVFRKCTSLKNPWPSFIFCNCKTRFLISQNLFFARSFFFWLRLLVAVPF